MAASGHRAPHSRHLQQVVQSNAEPGIITVQQTAGEEHQAGHHQMTAEHASSPSGSAQAATAQETQQDKHRKDHQAANAPSSPASDISKPAAASSGEGRSGLNIVVPLLGAAALAAAALLWRHLRGSKGAPGQSSPKGSAGSKATSKSRAGTKDARGKKRGPGVKHGDVASEQDQQAAQQDNAKQEPEPEPVLPDTLEIVVAPVQLQPPPNPPAPLPPLPLNNLTFVVSEDLEVEGSATTFGVPDWQVHYSTAEGTAPAIARAVSAGAACTGKVALQQAGLDFVGSNFGNLFNKTRVAGGGCTGAAVQVSQQAANFALCLDTLGEMRVAAACNGVLGYRPTPGVFGAATASSLPPNTGGFGTASVVCKDPSMMLKVAQALGAPGTANIKGEILQFVVAQDLCDMCAPELQPAILALKKAILKYAGSDQAGAVQLVKFLASHVRMYTELLPGTELAAGYAPPEGTGIRVDDFLEAALVACSILRAEELHQRAGAVQQAAAPMLTPNHGSASTAAGTTALEGALDKGDATTPAIAAEDTVGKVGAAVAAAPEGADTEQDTSTATAAEAGADGAVSQENGAASGTDSQQDTSSSAAVNAAGEAVASGDHQQQASQQQKEEEEKDQGTQKEDSQTKAAIATSEHQQQQKQEGESKSDTGTATEGPQVPQVLPPRPTSAQLAAARKMASGVMDCMRSTVKPDTIMVLPALPFPPPNREGADSMELVMWTKLTQCFNALASLASCPTLTAPVGHLRDGSPVAISLMAVHRFDQRLLAVAQKLCPMIQDSFQAVKEEITNMALQQARGEPAAAGAPATGAGSPAGPATPPRANGTLPAHGSSGNVQPQSPQQSPPQPQIDPKKLEKADKAKAKGNELYLAGKFLEALNEYTKAISLVPSSHVYYSNRAMACIKLFRFEQAEEDCNRALTFDLSDKDKVKALLRRATARDALQKYEGAEQDLKAVLRVEPNNKQAREDLQALRRHQAQMAESTAHMVAQMRAQAAASGSSSGGPGMPPGGMQLPPGVDPSMFPPGFDPSMIPPGLFGPDGQLMLGGQMGGYEPADGFTM